MNNRVCHDFLLRRICSSDHCRGPIRHDERSNDQTKTASHVEITFGVSTDNLEDRPSAAMKPVVKSSDKPIGATWPTKRTPTWQRADFLCAGSPRKRFSGGLTAALTRDTRGWKGAGRRNFGGLIMLVPPRTRPDRWAPSQSDRAGVNLLTSIGIDERPGAPPRAARRTNVRRRTAARWGQRRLSRQIGCRHR
jgi:hypothetical protein